MTRQKFPLENFFRSLRALSPPKLQTLPNPGPKAGVLVWDFTYGEKALSACAATGDQARLREVNDDAGRAVQSHEVRNIKPAAIGQRLKALSESHNRLSGAEREITVRRGGASQALKHISLGIGSEID